MNNTTEGNWITVAEAQKLLRNPRTGRQPALNFFYRLVNAGRLTAERRRFGRQRVTLLLEHEVRALSAVEGRVERRVRHADRVEDLARREAKVRQDLETQRILREFGALR